MVKTSDTARLAVALAVVVLCVLAPCALARAETSAPAVDARAWALADARSDRYLVGEDASARLSMGSTDKIMVGVVALDMVKAGEADLDESVTVSEEAAAFANPLYSNVGLVAGDVLSLRELLMAALIPSGNDAAYALAEHLGDGSVDRFVEKMNRKAREMGLGDTHFENPTGLDARGQYSSARDLADMARAAMKHPEFRRIVATDYDTVTTQNREIELVSTNELLYLYPTATGVKTGTTPGAGPSLVASAASGDEAYVSVVLDAREDRFAASIRALEHAFATYDRKDLVKRGSRYARAPMPHRRGETVDLVAGEDVEGLVDEGSDVERETRVMRDLPPSAGPGTTLGEVVVTVDGERVGQSPLVVRRGYDRASLPERLWYIVGGIFV